jgi:chloramphenicol 3-O-phosphotransferase
VPRRPLLLTGPPAVGKSSVARALAEQRPRSAIVEVDDLRRMVQAGAVAAWASAEGERQTCIAARHACALLASFTEAGFDAIATDVLLGDAGAVYASAVPRPLVVRLAVSQDEALRRAATRPVHLTEQEFHHLHRCERGAEIADAQVDTTRLSLEQLTVVVEELWRAAPPAAR